MNTYTKIKEYVNNLVVACSKKFGKKYVLEEQKQQELIQNINTVKKDWEIAKNNFELANSVASVDYYTYKIKAYEVKYQELLREAKRKGIRAPMLCERKTYLYSKY